MYTGLSKRNYFVEKIHSRFKTRFQTLSLWTYKARRIGFYWILKRLLLSFYVFLNIYKKRWEALCVFLQIGKRHNILLLTMMNVMWIKNIYIFDISHITESRNAFDEFIQLNCRVLFNYYTQLFLASQNCRKHCNSSLYMFEVKAIFQYWRLRLGGSYDIS